MYYPILRGKQFELIALRELAKHVPAELIRPVIEPVRSNVQPLKKTLNALSEYNIRPLVVVNPDKGDFSKSYIDFIELVKVSENFTPCLRIKSFQDISFLDEIGLNIDQVGIFLEGGLDKKLVERLEGAICVILNKEKVHSSAIEKLQNVVFYGDFFDKKNRNADYDESSYFSSIHTEWKNYSNVIGFGDYTILSEEYTESGGPAFVVTIHLSYINSDDYDAVYVRHFSSFNDDSPANPGGKFKSALDKVCLFIKNNPDIFFKSQGLEQLLSLEGGSFQGLGQIKKYSIKHHIETICDFVRGA